MISDRDRRVLADLERETRAQDPQLCERLSGLGSRSDRLPAPLRRATSTGAILGMVAALAGALMLAMPLASLLLIGALITSVTVRLWSAGDVEPSGPDGAPPHGRFPYGPPSFGPR